MSEDKQREDLLREAFEKKRAFFDAGKTKSYEFRIEQLRKLKKAVHDNEAQIMAALHKDLHKPAFEVFISEIALVLDEVGHAIKHLEKWMKPEKVSTPMALHPSSCSILSEPLGVVLIIGPWNYPFQLLLAPLIGAIAAGNCAILKPSDQTPNTSNLVSRMLRELYHEDYVSAVQGPGAMVGPMLIERYRFDHVFFTGSPSVGRKIAEMAARQLTPVTLELGGKSPVIVAKDAAIDVTAKRLVWAKFFNAGQTCVCPDYLLVHRSVKSELLEKMKVQIREFLGQDPRKSDSFARIVNERRFNALTAYLKDGDVIIGGDTDKDQRYIAPTILDNVSLDSPIMKEEVFGPILPVIPFDELTEVVSIVRRNRYPLALYLYTESKSTEEYILERIEFGGGCINNGMVHLANTALPFGGVGNSGMGSYHGKYSFDVFSHKKSIVKTTTMLDPSLRSDHLIPVILI